VNPFKYICRFVFLIKAYRKKGISFRAYFCCDFSIEKIPDSTIMCHPVGIVISPAAVIGSHCIILQNVTIGKIRGLAPKIGNNVYIGAGAIIIGGVNVGNNVTIGAGSIVISDVPDNSIYVNRITPVVKPSTSLTV
jgi:serine O-acetyltransferase